ncbi:MAG: GNAT family N-acetyltransferase, partial [Burkholderiaceae bacterium]
LGRLQAGACEHAAASSLVFGVHFATSSADVLRTPRLTVEQVAAVHAPLLADFFRHNDAHLARWDPPRPAGIQTLEFWQAECERAVDEINEGLVARWVIRLRDEPQVIGRINYTQIARGPFQSCVLGYALDAEYQGRGLMRESLEATIAHTFDVLRLHRIQANYMPSNIRSGRLLRKLGFKREGVALSYLYIDGAWRDHVVTALINPHFDDAVFKPKS